jgi:hypothetical protein
VYDFLVKFFILGDFIMTKQFRLTANFNLGNRGKMGGGE